MLAKTLGVKGYSVAKKADLITLIEKHQGGVKPLATEDEAKAKMEEPKKADALTQVKEKTKRANDWNNYLADYRKEHNVTLRQAMAGAKESYLKHKESKKAEAPVEEKRPSRDLP
jgi:hypothetical protein